MDNRSITHTRWNCTYHIVFIPKYEDKRIFRIPLKTDPRIFTKVAWIPSLYLERRKTLQMPCCSSQVKKDLLSMVPVW